MCLGYRIGVVRSLEEQMEIEYVGELLSDEHLSVTPEVLAKFHKGQPLKITVEPLSKHVPQKENGKNLMDAATQRFLAGLENAPRLGRIKGNLSREDMYEDMADDRF